MTEPLPVATIEELETCPDCYDGGACLPGGCGVPGCARCGKPCPTCNGSCEARARSSEAERGGR